METTPRSLGTVSIHLSTLKGRHGEKGFWLSGNLQQDQSIVRCDGPGEVYPGVSLFIYIYNVTNN